MDMVHSDIRFSNIVFSSDGRSASLIDFDLAADVDTWYPENYNHDIKERHHHALAGYPTKKEHDCHSLWYNYFEQLWIA